MSPTQYVTISVNHKLMCTIQFPHSSLALTFVCGIFSTKVEKQWWQCSSLYPTIRNRKKWQIFAYPDFTI